MQVPVKLSLFNMFFFEIDNCLVIILTILLLQMGLGARYPDFVLIIMLRETELFASLIVVLL